MSSIGPQLPPHLAKRKRTPEDEGQDQLSSPKSKNARVATEALPPPYNKEELALDDSDADSDDGYGPRAIQPGPVGPSLPPKGNTDEIDLDDDSNSESGVGPRPPTGPSLPQTLPAPAAEAAVEEDESSSDDDDDYGPALPSKTTARPQIGPSLPPGPSQDNTPQRDSWMLAPPTATGYTERDPTKLKARKFASSKSSSSKQAAGAQPASIWTETPEEKLRRLQDSVLGRGGGSGASAEAAGDSAAAARAREEEERNRRIAASVEAQRGKSLMDEHGSKRKQQGADKEEEDDPSQRAFDREKDMALGGKIGAAKRKELLNKAADFGGRFQKGSYL